MPTQSPGNHHSFGHSIDDGVNRLALPRGQSIKIYSRNSIDPSGTTDPKPIIIVFKDLVDPLAEQSVGFTYLESLPPLNTENSVFRSHPYHTACIFMKTQDGTV